MALVKTEAIILRTAKMGETSKLLTLYSLKDGILKLIAKGARSPKSRMGGTLETLNVVEVVYYEKSNRDLQFLSQASIVFAPKNLLKDAERTVMAMVCTEMIARLEKEQNPNASIFGLLRAALEAFNQENANGRLILFAFQMQLLRFLGFAPDLSQCASCGTGQSIKWQFQLTDAKLYCNECLQSLNSGFSLQAATLSGLRKLAKTPLTNITAIEIARTSQAEIYNFLTAFYSNHLEEARFLKTIEVLKQMKAMERDNFVKRKK
ncbi:MAG: DNA repair protein RecO [bacterium]